MKYTSACAFLFFLFNIQKHCQAALHFLNWEYIYQYFQFGDDLGGDRIRETLIKRIFYLNSYSGLQRVVLGNGLSWKMQLYFLQNRL